jgi:hypothetical protein
MVGASPVVASEATPGVASLLSVTVAVGASPAVARARTPGVTVTSEAPTVTVGASPVVVRARTPGVITWLPGSNVMVFANSTHGLLSVVPLLPVARSLALLSPIRSAKLCVADTVGSPPAPISMTMRSPSEAETLVLVADTRRLVRVEA